MINAANFMALLATPRLTSLLQSSLSPNHPLLQTDGFFGPATGKALGQAYLNNTLPLEWESQIPSYEQMYTTQLIIAVHFPITIDGYFGPETGEKLGQLMMDRLHIPRQKTNDEAIALLKNFEGNGLSGHPFRAYVCPTGKPTIGWGHTKYVSHKDVNNGRTITELEAETLLKTDLAFFEDSVCSSLTTAIGSNMFSACVLLSYNIGQNAFKTSTVRREINNRNYQAAAAAFEMWNKGHVNGRLKAVEGLSRRRKEERKLFELDL